MEGQLTDGPMRHVVMFTWKDGVTEGQVEAVGAALRRLPGVIAEISDYRFGPDLRVNEGNVDYAVVADFASLNDYLVYRDHPDHRQVITDVLLPLIASRSAVQFTTG